MKDALCIVASHPLAQRFDFSRTDCDIWGFNEVMKMDWYKRADAVFQMHLAPIWKNPKNRNDPNHYYWLTNTQGTCNICEGKGRVNDKDCVCDNGIYKPQKRDGVKIYMMEAQAEVPNSESYPLAEVTAALLSNFKWSAANKKEDNRYFTSSPAQAIALGIHLGYKRIECWGMEMNTDTEYRYQRDGITFWQGIAIGKGVELVAYTDIYNAPIYGYEGEATLEPDVFRKRFDELKKPVEQAVAEYNAAKEAADKAAVEFMNTGKNAEAVQNTLKAQISAMYNYAAIDGAMQENDRYQSKMDAMANVAGGYQFSRQEFEQGAMDNGKKRAQAEAQAHAAGGRCTVLWDAARKHKNLNRRRHAMKEFAKAAEEYLRQSGWVGLFTGAYQENTNYMQTLDQLVKAAGGVKSEEVLLEVANAEI